MEGRKVQLSIAKEEGARGGERRPVNNLDEALVQEVAAKDTIGSRGGCN